MIWHLLPLPQWRSAGHGVYIPGTETTAGYVHASPDESSVLAVANAFYAQCEHGLVALGIDESRLSAPVRYEPAEPAPPPGVAATILFPHVYGPVEVAAVTEIRYVRRDSSGRYTVLEPLPATAEAPE
jgi:uncharacterized protein